MTRPPEIVVGSLKSQNEDRTSYDATNKFNEPAYEWAPLETSEIMVMEPGRAYDARYNTYVQRVLSQGNIGFKAEARIQIADEEIMPRVYDKGVLEGIGEGVREFLDGQLRSMLGPDGEGGEEGEEEMEEAVQSGEEKEDGEAEKVDGEAEKVDEEGEEKKKIEPIRGF